MRNIMVSINVGFREIEDLATENDGVERMDDGSFRMVLDHQAEFNIVAVNLSLGAGNYMTNPYTFLDEEFTAIRNAGGFISVAAGNSYIIAATIEVGFYDSTTNALLGAYRDSARADPIRREAGGATWGQVKAALDAWAQKLRARVDAAQTAR